MNFGKFTNSYDDVIHSDSVRVNATTWLISNWSDSTFSQITLQLTAAIPSLNLSFQNALIKNGLEGKSQIFKLYFLFGFKALFKDFTSRAAALLLIIIGKLLTLTGGLFCEGLHGDLF